MFLDKGKGKKGSSSSAEIRRKKKVAPSPRGTPSSLGSDSGGFFRSSPSVPFALSSYSQRPSSSSFSCSSSLNSSALSSHCLADEASFQSQSSSKTSALPRCTNCCQVLKECLVCKKCSYLFCPPCTMYLVHFGGLKCPKGRSHSFDLKKGKQDIAEVLSSSSSSLFFPTSPISSKTPSPLFLPFKFNNKQVDEILMFLVDEYDSATSSSSISSLYSSSSSSSFSTAKVPSSKPFGSENAIQLFLAAFANFDIDKVLFFVFFVFCFFCFLFCLFFSSPHRNCFLVLWSLLFLQMRKTGFFLLFSSFKKKTLLILLFAFPFSFLFSFFLKFFSGFFWEGKRSCIKIHLDTLAQAIRGSV